MPLAPIRPPDAFAPDNDVFDSDCDGISDADEFGDLWPGGRKTDPALRDSDGDGILDGVEAGRVAPIDDACPATALDLDATSRTNPTLDDSDGDCLPDGVEDRNRNGRLDPGETDPTSGDSDADGLPDGEEDANCNGVVDASETDPRRPDSDDDGLSDAAERALGSNPLLADSDGDGASDGEEWAAGSDPNEVPRDGDGDGLDDEQERARGSDPALADSDGDGLCDGPLSVAGICEAGEDLNGNGRWDPGESDPARPDSDCDALSDAAEVLEVGTDPTRADSDGDGLPDGLESGVTAPIDPACAAMVFDADPTTRTSPLLRDSDGDGRNDGVEDRNRDGAFSGCAPGGAGESDPLNPDTDGDGRCDGSESLPGVCVAGEDRNGDGLVSGSETDPCVPDTDSDLDGIPDVRERIMGTRVDHPDSDGDGLCDGPASVPSYCVAGEDMDADGVVDPLESDPLEPDSDCDALSDGEERALMTDPLTRDSDQDGLSDGVEVGRGVGVSGSRCTAVPLDADPSAATNSNPLLRDSDGDGLSDGTEDRNLDGALAPPSETPRETSPSLPDTDGDGRCDGPRTVVGVCVAGEDLDGDGRQSPGESDPRTPDLDRDGDGLLQVLEDRLGTSDLNADTDGDGLCDGARAVPGVCVAGEDRNSDGQTSAGETNPLLADSDCDALSDGEELQSTATSPLLADSDGDLVPDGVELGRTLPLMGPYGCASAPLDQDPASQTNPLLVDSDGDGLNDGVEDLDRDGELAAPNPGGIQESDPTNADTDGDGRCDGPGQVVGTCVAGEDLNRNGRVDGAETDPRVADIDGDGDGLSDADERDVYLTRPDVADTDGDGLLDGAEVQLHRTDPRLLDSDCDGLGDAIELDLGTSPLDPDSDGDGLSDGLERGSLCRVGVDTDAACAMRCAADGDGGATQTDPQRADTDGDGVVDGAEDSNGNGVADPGELDPRASNDAGGAVAEACAQPTEPVLHARDLPDILLATVPEISIASAADIRSGGEVVGLSVVDAAARIVAFALRVSPTQSPLDQLQQLEGQVAARVAPLTVPLRQALPLTWDGYLAARGSANLQSVGALSDAARGVIRALLLDPSANVAFPGLVDEQGAGNPPGFKLSLVVVHRSPSSAIVTGALTLLAAHDDPAAGRDFRLEDLAGGTALGQVGDRTGQQCERFASAGRQPVDILWVLDNSGSMGDELAAVEAAAAQMVDQLNNSTLDWRIAVVTTEFQYRSGAPVFDGSLGRCAFSEFESPFIYGVANRPCICRFVGASNAPEFRSCVAAIQQRLEGSAYEGGYGALQSALRDVFLAPGASGGGRLRDEARLVTLFVTDAGEQTPAASADWKGNPFDPSDDLDEGVTHWTRFFRGGPGEGTWDPNRSDEPPMILGGLLCPFDADCVNEEDSTGPQPPTYDVQGWFRGESLARDRYYRVIGEMNGIIGAIANEQGGTLANLSDIPASIEAILNVAIGAATPYELSRAPIASTLKVALEGPVVDPARCPLDALPRSRTDGFAYDAATKRISLYGACRTLEAGSDVVVSYKTWVDRTDCPDGCSDPCAECADPYVCVREQCVCPSDCGTGAAIPASQTCEPATCTLQCAADCGGCPGGQVCDASACRCTCPEDGYGGCGGPAPAPSMVCDADTCAWTCAQGCDPDLRPSASATCDLETCSWTCDACGGVPPPEGYYCDDDPAVCDFACAADCGGCSAGEICDRDACACVCPADCGQSPRGAGFACNPATCVLECTAVPDEATRPGPRFIWDATRCDWRCPEDCGGDAPGAGFACDEGSCAWFCPLDCGGCEGNERCDVTSCTCTCPEDCGTPAPGAEYQCDRESCAWTCRGAPDESTRPGDHFIWDVQSCDWVCPENCGGAVFDEERFSCDPSTCDARCLPDCGGRCGPNERCDADACDCVCDESTTCAAGFRFDSERCACVCDLECPATHVVDLGTCSCACAEACGGCGAGTYCQPSLCACVPFGG